MPEFPEAYAVGRFDPRSGYDAWATYLFLLRDGSSLVGSGGYKGEPRDGVVEVGYEIAPDFRNHDFATEATRGMVDYAFSHEDVEVVEAHRRSPVFARDRGAGCSSSAAEVAEAAAFQLAALRKRFGQSVVL